MRRTGLAILALIILTLYAVPRITVAQSVSRTVTIAVVRDGPSAPGDLADAIEAELQALLPADATVRFKSTPAFDANWNVAKAKQALESAMADPEVNYLLVTGPVVSRSAALGGITLTKPVISSSPQTADLFDIPYSADGKSLVDNFSFVVSPKDVQRDIAMFAEMIDFDTMHVAVGAEEAPDLEHHRAAIEEIGDRIGIHIVFLPLESNAHDHAAQLDSGVKAIFLARTPRLSRSQRRAFIEEINARKIPSFSLVGHADVEMGALAGLEPDDTQQIVRRVAINISQLYRGVAVADLPVVLTVEPSLLINAQTAAAIGYVPSVSVKAQATFLHPEYLEVGARPLTLAEAMKTAEVQNLALMIKDADVDVSRRDMQVSRGGMLPQIGLQASGQHLKNDFLTQILPENVGQAGFRATQMIYDDRVVSNYRSSKRLLDGDREDREAQRLDVLQEAADAFIQYVLARALLEIDRDNYRLTADNLALAKRRLEVGHSGRDEVFRWEAELARRRIAVFNSEADVEAARLALNQILALDQSVRWIPETIDVRSDEFYFLEGRVTDVFGGAGEFEQFRQFMVSFAVETAPELALFDNVVDAQSIQLGQRKRQFLLPRFGVDVDFNYQFWRDPDAFAAQKDTWTIQVFALLPLFEGTSRYYDMQRIKSGLAGLEHERQLARDRIEQRARTSIRRLEGSYPSIGLSRQAADNAKRNLDVVQEKYSQGIVNVTDLLEAQTNSFVADQSAVISSYGFLLDLMEFERSIAWFEVEKSPEERDEMVQRIRSAVGSP